MRRDWDLIRSILQMLEEKITYGGVVRPDSIAGYDEETVSYHMHILTQAGIITSKCKENRAGLFCLALNLTWEGHELVDSIKNDTVWNRLRGLLKEKSVDLSYAAVKTAALHVMKTQLLS